jgi:transcriptional regulator with XRE-family HTH domain
MTEIEFCATLDRLKLSRRQLALRLGVAESTVRRWACGELPVPRYAAYVLELLDTLDNFIDVDDVR